MESSCCNFNIPDSYRSKGLDFLIFPNVNLGDYVSTNETPTQDSLSLHGNEDNYFCDKEPPNSLCSFPVISSSTAEVPLRKNDDLAKIAYKQVDILTNIIEERMSQLNKKTEENSLIHPGSTFNSYFSNLSQIMPVTYCSNPLPPSLRLEINTKIQLYQCIAYGYEQRKNAIETGFKIVDDICSFCRNNKEPEFIYRSHRLKYNGKITCPILRLYQCPLCNASGDEAHTLKYCPKYSRSRYESTKDGINYDENLEAYQKMMFQVEAHNGYL